MGLADRDYMRPPSREREKMSGSGPRMAAPASCAEPPVLLRVRWRGARRLVGWAAFWCAIVAVASGAIYSGRSWPSSLEKLSKEAFPATGAVRYYGALPASAFVAPMTIHAGDAASVVKLETWDSHAPVLMVFVEAGRAVRVHVPVGRYRLKYATGDVWYGEAALFGRGTDSFVVSAPVEAYRTSVALQGADVHLDRWGGGNVPMSVEPPDRF